MENNPESPRDPSPDRWRAHSNLRGGGARMSLAVSIPPAPWGSGPPPLSRGEGVAQANQLLRNHDYERGWLGFEARTYPGRRGFPGALADLRNKTVLVRGEYGNGD